LANKNIKDKLLIKISDNGIGMDKQTQKHIFDKFYRGQKGNIYHHKGLGLGLFYVKKSIESHGGKIEVYSKIGKGTSFSIYLNKIM
jgi:two-component system phosphate regulon sensor histidine kinase PhoR